LVSIAAEATTRERILAAARQVFAERGFDAGTVRDITDLASVNTAAINYHFRSKEELIRTVFVDGLVPMIEERSTALERCIAQASPDLPSLDALVEALVRPLVELAIGQHREAMMMLMHVRTSGTPMTRDIVNEQFAPVHRRFVDALCSVLPHLSREEVAFRYDCARSATLQTLVELAPASTWSKLALHGSAGDRDLLVRRLCQFIVAGMASTSG
jgi:AcrR family transcriptional regulator